MDLMDYRKAELEEDFMLKSEAVLKLFPERFQIFDGTSHEQREQLAQRLGLIPALLA